MACNCGKTKKLVWVATFPNGEEQTYATAGEARAAAQPHPPGSVGIKPKEVAR